MAEGAVRQFESGPSLEGTFKPSVIEKLLHQMLQEKLQDKVYDQDNTPIWTRELSDEIRVELKKLGMDRYKFLVQVVVGEQRGAGVRMASRSLWDSKTDGLATASFVNEHLFCTATAIGIYLY